MIWMIEVGGLNAEEVCRSEKLNGSDGGGGDVLLPGDAVVF